MKIPKKIKIGGFIWEVKESKEVTAEGNCYGSTHHSLQKIFLEPKMTKQKTEQVFLHEVLHAIWDHAGMNANKKFDKESEEMIINPLANGLYQVLNDNKLLK